MTDVKTREPKCKPQPRHVAGVECPTPRLYREFRLLVKGGSFATLDGDSSYNILDEERWRHAKEACNATEVK